MTRHDASHQGKEECFGHYLCHCAPYDVLFISFRKLGDSLSVSMHIGDENCKEEITKAVPTNRPPFPTKQTTMKEVVTEVTKEGLSTFSIMMEEQTEKLNLFKKQTDAKYNNMKGSFLQLHKDFSKKIDNEEEATAKLQKNDTILR
ncbi:hypothetical protein BDD12DRAFT_885447 [Trichophaea hybrida]|nr:hypothetical protein BDD12DRAFT_885447 [Trichophaea hybrida]